MNGNVLSTQQVWPKNLQLLQAGVFNDYISFEKVYDKVSFKNFHSTNYKNKEI